MPTKPTPEARQARIQWAEKIVQTMVATPLAVGTTLAKLQLLYLINPRLPGSRSKLRST